MMTAREIKMERRESNEKLYIKLTEVALEVKHTSKLLEEYQDSNLAYHAKIDKVLNGNGKEGVVIQVDRLEQVEIKRQRNARILIGAAVTFSVGLLGKILYDILVVLPMLHQLQQTVIK